MFHKYACDKLHNQSSQNDQLLIPFQFTTIQSIINLEIQHVYDISFFNSKIPLLKKKHIPVREFSHQPVCEIYWPLYLAKRALSI